MAKTLVSAFVVGLFWVWTGGHEDYIYWLQNINTEIFRRSALAWPEYFAGWRGNGSHMVLLTIELMVVVAFAITVFISVVRMIISDTKVEIEVKAGASLEPSTQRAAPEGHGNYNPKLGGSPGSKY